MEQYLIWDMQEYDADVILNVLGQNDRHLKMIADHLGVELSVEGGRIVTTSAEKQPQLQELFSQLLAIYESAGRISAEDVAGLLHNGTTAAFYKVPVASGPGGRNFYLHSPGQQEFYQALQTHDITIAVGPAGTGKTFLSVVFASNMLKKGLIRKIIVTRPVVEAGESLGYLPGDLQEKVDPYLRPIYDSFDALYGPGAVDRMVKRGIVEIAPLAYMRGRTLNDAVVILDEAQNTTPMQIKMFLTRLGFNSRMIINGDITQVDLPPHKMSGLVQALSIVEGIEGIAVVRLDKRDVVRHPLVQKILEAYENADHPDGG